jgi:hypothetical protein
MGREKGHEQVQAMIGPAGQLRTVLLASAAAVLPFAALSAGSASATATSSSGFSPAAEPMVLTRALRRPLPGGAEVSTRRSYEIRFVRDGQGYRIDGELIDVSIDVPPAYEALAALERARPDTGMFPMHIDAGGRLVAAPSQHQAQFAQQAGQLAQSRVPATLSPDESRNALAFIGQVSASPSQTAWPDDLFRPSPGKHVDTHVVPLPGGKTGEVAIEIEASVEPGSGLVTTLRRNVTTRLGDTLRQTIETWTLSRKG